MGIRECLRQGHGRVFIFSYLGYVVVGLGSMAFHATLKCTPHRLPAHPCLCESALTLEADSMQLADELPMIYTTCIVAYASFSYARPKGTQILVGIGLLGLASWITVYYLSSQNPVFHQVAYAVLMLSLVFRAMYDMETTLRPALRTRCETPAHGDEILRRMWKIAYTGKRSLNSSALHAITADLAARSSGIVLFLMGFSIWLLDNALCQHLRSARNSVLLPWAALLEGHAWWHIFTGIGVYYCITWRLWLEKCLDGGERDFELIWASPITSVPKVLPRTEHTSKANSNGHANGNENGHKKTI